jgi:GNAT superfamily N-acetyltransferase
MEYIALEKLQEAHVHDLLALYRAEWWTRARRLEDVRRMLDGSDLVVGFCRPEGGLVAFARVLTDGVFKAIIFDVIVHPGVRGRGLGRRLIERIITHPSIRDVRHLELYCLPEMIPFYEKWGFSTDVSGVVFMRRVAGEAPAWPPGPAS